MPTRPKTHRPHDRLPRHRPTPTPLYEGKHKLYGRKWKARAKAWLEEHPLCVTCEVEGRVVPAEAVDHVRPHRGDPGIFWDADNLQGLCLHHHNSKTARGE